MPTLPDATSFGERPDPRPARNVANYDPTSGMEQAPAQELARTGEQVGQVAQIAAQMSAEMEKAAIRVQNRQDSIERARDYGNFERAATDQLLKSSTEGDISRQETVDGYRQFIDEAKNKIISEHRGSADSRMQLAAKLEEDRFKFIGQAASASIAAQKAIIDRNIGSTLNQLTDSTYNNPKSLLQNFQALDSRIADMAGGLTPEEEAQHIAIGRAKIASAAIESYITRQDFDGAQAVLQVPGVSQVIGAEAQSRMYKAINDQKYSIEAARRKGVAEATSKIAELTTFLQRPPTDQEVAEYSGISAKPGNMFGGGPTGMALEYLTKLAPLYANGQATDEQKRIFETALTQATQPVSFLDPVTGLPSTRVPQIPAFISEAARRGGLSINQHQATQQPAQSGSTTSMEGAKLIGNTPAGNPIYSVPDDYTAREMMHNAAQNGQKIVVHVDPPSGLEARQSEGVFSLANKMTGPVASVAALMGKTPGIAEMADFKAYVQSQQYFKTIKGDLISTLQNSPRFAQGEKNQIEHLLDVDPAVFDSPTGWRQRLVAIDKGLEQRERDAYNTSHSKNVDMETRRHNMAVFNALVKFREKLDIPPTVSSPEEAAMLGPGAVFLTPEGDMKRVPLKAAK